MMLLRQIRTLAALQHAGAQRTWRDQPELQQGAGKLLAELAQCGEARISDLAERRMVDASVVSRQVAQLQKLGYVARHKAESDARVVLLTVTPTGQEALTRWREHQVELLAAALDGWDADRVLATSKVLEGMNTDLRAALEPGGSMATKAS
jgi:DNA-binding MarR family transcriptional regulator